eukprot:CAMPEP_0172475668 /NCGR_PEP_ID=MMETSP1065-20121228/69988_1 /TAXON_ID=265537 /ORGANISM="Amphiprora paludosa, Strain CCMP125" /LENGTH=377 /DNA_ID=CAMNT_0013233881 /DNA_START=134 /DNA_END=1267 /DNA_ORIENTATION=-
MDQAELSEQRTENLRLRLDGVPRLDDHAQWSFEETTEQWYHEIYQSENAHFRRLRRFLQLNGVVDFSTEVSVRSQHGTRNGTIVSYDQFISYRTEDNATMVNPLIVLVTPFDNEYLRDRYVDELRIANPFFEHIPKNAIVAPDPDFIFDETAKRPVFDETDDELEQGGGGSSMLMSALLSAIIGVLAIALICVLRRRRQSKKRAYAQNRFLAKQESSMGFDESEELYDEPRSAVLRIPSGGDTDVNPDQVMANRGAAPVALVPPPTRFSDFSAEVTMRAYAQNRFLAKQESSMGFDESEELYDEPRSAVLRIPSGGDTDQVMANRGAAPVALAPPPTRFSDFSAEVTIQNRAYDDLFEPSIELSVDNSDENEPRYLS